MNYTKKNISGHAAASCYVKCYDNGDIDFISYYTRVISVVYRDGKRMIECTGTYSATTRKQIGWFCREYLPGKCYHDMKEIAGEGYIAC